MDVIETVHLTKRFKTAEAVKDLNLRVGEGELFGFLGPNGAGKTTTIKMLLGFIKPSAGFAKVLGHPAGEKAARESIGYVPEELGFYDVFTGAENLDYYGRLFGLDRDTRGKRVEENLKLVGLEEKADTRVREYSHGMKQRLGIAQALMNDPTLLILDEPTNGLDPRGMKDVRDLINKLAERKAITIFLSSHLLLEVQQVCRVVGILNKGRMSRVDQIDRLSREIEKESGIYVTFACTTVNDEIVNAVKEVKGVEEVEANGSQLKVKVSGDVTPQINAAIVMAGGGVRSITEHTPDLEEIFMRWTE